MVADFPIYKRIDMDGRPVPFVYPQHKTKDGYEETGYDNPLPTGNHVMTKGGIWIPQRGSDDGAAHTQVTGSNVEDEKLFNRDVIAGSYVDFESQTIVTGDRMTFGISWANSSNFRVLVFPRSSDGRSLDHSFVLIDNSKESSSRKIAEYHVMTKYNLIRIYNDGESDNTINVAVLTVFNGGSNIKKGLE